VVRSALREGSDKGSTDPAARQPSTGQYYVTFPGLSLSSSNSVVLAMPDATSAESTAINADGESYASASAHRGRRRRTGGGRGGRDGGGRLNRPRQPLARGG
jgi:hypothetical protein